ncbi:putative salt-induced outer membrane protein [uncultured Thiomicrorhabdus sp.]
MNSTKKCLNRKTHSVILASLLAASSLTAMAENGFKGSGELGYSDMSGNTESTSLYASLKLSYTQDVFEIKSLIEANYQEEGGDKTQERYLVDLQGNRYYNGSKTYYSFLGARFEKSFSEGIDLDSTYTGGLGRTLYKTDATKLTGELGVGYQTVDYSTAFGGGSDDNTIGRVKADLTHTFNENVDFTQDLITTVGISDKNTKIEANSALKVKLAEKMRLSAGFKYRRNSDPAAGAEKVDKQTLLTLVFDF